jgi:hypothetical protein
MQLKQPLEVDLKIMDGGLMPKKLSPGTVFVLDDTSDNSTFGPGKKYIAAFSCPRCTYVGFITGRELHNQATMICGGDDCSAEYHIEDDKLVFRKPQ